MMLQIVATTWCSPSEQVWSEQFNLFTVVNDSTALSIFLVDVGRYPSPSHATNHHQSMIWWCTSIRSYQHNDRTRRHLYTLWRL